MGPPLPGWGIGRLARGWLHLDRPAGPETTTSPAHPAPAGPDPNDQTPAKPLPGQPARQHRHRGRQCQLQTGLIQRAPSHRLGRLVGRQAVACSPCSASCSCFSASLEREVLRTVLPYLDKASIALSVVICSTTMNSADVPGFSISRT